MRKYYEVRILCVKEVTETLCSFLMENGALGAVEENVFVDRIKKGKVKEKVIGYFDSENDFFKIRGALKLFLNELKKNFQNFYSYRIITRKLKDKNWREGYKKYFKPIKVSRRIVVKPDYEKYFAKEHETVVLINPQMAFGIGNHPTTKMCIKYIDKILDGVENPAKLSVLDVGTGSGIIAISAALLGAGDVYGFDIDEVSHEVACENVEKNGVMERVKLGCHGLEKVKKKYDIIAANILSNVLIDMRDKLLSVIKSGGDLILSGILDTQKDEVIKAFLADTPLKLVDTDKEKEWVVLHFKRAIN